MPTKRFKLPMVSFDLASSTGILFLSVYFTVLLLRTAKPHDTTQLEELAGRVSILEGLSHCALCFHLLILRILTVTILVSGEKETLSSQHQAELRKQREETAHLKEDLIQAKQRHATELKESTAVRIVELEHATKELVELHAQEIKEV
jgi:hypothetical protein